MKEGYVLDGQMGLCVGDALGVPVEFKPREELDADPVQGMRGFGSHMQPPGTWSDDSSLALCLADSLCNGYDLRDIAARFCSWFFDEGGCWRPHGEVFDVGETTRMAIGQLAKKLANGDPPEMAGGDAEEDVCNGSLMRILPVAFLTYGMPEHEMLRTVEEVSSLTHRHKRPIIACCAYVSFANSLMGGLDKEAAFRQMQEDLPRYFGGRLGEQYGKEMKHFSRLLGGGFPKLERRQIRSEGYAVDTLEAAIWCFMNSRNYNDTVLSAVNLGWDTDTTGAVAGGLAGLYYGFGSIPAEWVEEIARKNEIITLSGRLEQSLRKYR